MTEAVKDEYTLIVRVLAWPVTFVEGSEIPKPIELTTTSLDFEFTSTDAITKYVDFINHAPVSYVSSDVSAAIESISVTLPDSSLTSGSIPVTIKPAEPLVPGDHTAVPAAVPFPCRFSRPGQRRPTPAGGASQRYPE